MMLNRKVTELYLCRAWFLTFSLFLIRTTPWTRFLWTVNFDVGKRRSFKHATEVTPIWLVTRWSHSRARRPWECWLRWAGSATSVGTATSPWPLQNLNTLTWDTQVTSHQIPLLVVSYFGLTIFFFAPQLSARIDLRELWGLEVRGHSRLTGRLITSALRLHAAALCHSSSWTQALPLRGNPPTRAWHREGGWWEKCMLLVASAVQRRSCWPHLNTPAVTSLTVSATFSGTDI